MKNESDDSVSVHLRSSVFVIIHRFGRCAFIQLRVKSLKLSAQGQLGGIGIQTCDLLISSPML